MARTAEQLLDLYDSSRDAEVFGPLDESEMLRLSLALNGRRDIDAGIPLAFPGERWTGEPPIVGLCDATPPLFTIEDEDGVAVWEMWFDVHETPLPWYRRLLRWFWEVE